MDLLDPSWYQSQLRSIISLIQDPESVHPGPAEPVLEVVVAGAELSELATDEGSGAYNSYRPFVRMYMDGELVGETSLSKRYLQTPKSPLWFERFLVVPRGCLVSRFEVCTGAEYPYIRGFCAISTESLWKAVTSGGPLTVRQQLLRPPSLNPKIKRIDESALPTEIVGTLRLHVRLWDRLPIKEPIWWESLENLPEPVQFVPRPAPLPPQSFTVGQAIPMQMLVQPPIVLPSLPPLLTTAPKQYYWSPYTTVVPAQEGVPVSSTVLQQAPLTLPIAQRVA